MARKKTEPKKEAFGIRSLSLSQENNRTLELLSKDASDFLGWTVSSSAVARGLLRYAEQQGYEWARSQLFPFIEREISSGIVWGKKK